jgi:hypothetical protein
MDRIGLLKMRLIYHCMSRLLDVPAQSYQREGQFSKGSVPIPNMPQRLKVTYLVLP